MVTADLTRGNEIEKVMKETINHFKQIDVLVSIIW